MHVQLLGDLSQTVFSALVQRRRFTDIAVPFVVLHIREETCEVCSRKQTAALCDVCRAK